jgi:hypothetical protein
MEEIKDEKSTVEEMVRKVIKVEPIKARIFDMENLAISPEFVVTGVTLTTVMTSVGELQRKGLFDNRHITEIKQRLGDVQESLAYLKPTYQMLTEALNRAGLIYKVIDPLEPEEKATPQEECSSAGT